MALQPFTDNFADNSTEAGFQFTFFCAICKEGYKTKFVESKSYKKGKFFKGLGSLVGAVAQMAGKHNIGYGAEKVTDVIAGKHVGMSPQWRKEYDAAFELSQTEAKAHFHRCPKCTEWVCENCWNEQEGLCTRCAPREAVEVASARAKKKAEDIQAKAQATKVFTGPIESKQTICSVCGKPAGTGKFCVNCGAPLSLVICPKCGAKNPAGTSFCGECGNPLK